MLDTNIFNRVVERQLPLYVPKSPQKISDGRRQRLSLLDSVCCSLDGSKCGLKKDCHGKEPNSNDTSEGRPQPVVVERHGDTRKQAQ
jgi:hypothetical protein